jgi:glucose-1-phosphate adenylyltransferase
MRNVITVALGGGAGTRLYPLTQLRSKPAVPFGGKYRIIDVPLSNCLNSGLNRIYLLTQYNSASLNQHVSATYRFSQFSRGFVNVLAAEQTPGNERWFQGTADAVRQVMGHLETHGFERVLIISGDQLYQMDFQDLLAAHDASGAEITVATTPVRAEDAPGFGIMQTGGAGRIERFVEKPPADQLAGLESDAGDDMRRDGRVYLASMGIYVFEREVLFELLRKHAELVDFGRDVIPFAISRHAVHSYPFTGYWTDIGTIASFYEANLAMTRRDPPLVLTDAERPVFTHARNLPPSELWDAQLDHCVVSAGVILDGCRARNSVIGVRSVVRPGADIDSCVLMGADYHESESARAAALASGRPLVGIGPGTRLSRAIVDKNARIGRDCLIQGTADRPDAEGEHHVIRDGIIVIRKNAMIPDGTRI